MESGLLLDVVVRKGAAVFELLAGEDQALLVRWDALLVCADKLVYSQRYSQRPFQHTLDLALDIVDGVGRLHLEGDGLPREGLDKDLHVEDLDSQRRQSVPHSPMAGYQRALEGRRMTVKRENEDKWCAFLPRQSCLPQSSMQRCLISYEKSAAEIWVSTKMFRNCGSRALG
jgi:hypothetical protein